MFVTAGSEDHPLFQIPPIHVIRRIRDKKIWYLYSHDLKQNKAVWSRQYPKAHEFFTKSAADDFIKVFLGTRGKECDVFCIDQQWAI